MLLLLLLFGYQVLTLSTLQIVVHQSPLSMGFPRHVQLLWYAYATFFLPLCKYNGRKDILPQDST